VTLLLDENLSRRLVPGLQLTSMSACSLP